ncbi:ABC transporter permease [Metamycoplasma equirhinis]|uniref:ABC transporter permease n=1 Tax=Metamycoplasma equirhinis TaxID=92402 RepID=A0ABZ0PBC3_9BACT|nr:ABC transporter permease [Metamycoplasma equirhinis]TPD97756.1 ABC transporter permease [Metamycoplasma equirhinis]WPB54150.1 ABC transporter permease [Metamycoplasma equirhinis]BDX52607.1 peptide ABC transporter permease [Metamycoplasma equirhinis]
MFKYIRQRIAFAILTLFIISFFVYILIAAFGPNPVQQLAVKEYERLKTSGKTFNEVLQNLEIQNGLRYVLSDGTPGAKIPIIVRYFRYIGGIFRGDFGFVINPSNNPDPSSYKTMGQLFFKPLKYTLLITFPTFIASSIIGISIGVFAGYKRGKFFDSASNLFALIFIAVPSFIIAPIAIAIALSLGVSAVVPRPGDQPFLATFIAYLPPIIVMTLSSLAAYVTYTRNQVVTVLTSNYVLIAKTKGLSSRQIFFKYVLRNISIPLFSLIFGSFIGLLSGSIIIEKYWQVPGTSSVIVSAFPSGEINVVMFSTLFFTLVSLIAEIIIDVSFAILDPKITYVSNSKKNYLLFLRAYKERKKITRDYFVKNLLTKYHLSIEGKTLTNGNATDNKVQ